MSLTIQAYLAFDGSVHRDLAGVLKADAASAIRQFSRRHGIGRGGEWSAEMINNVLISHGFELSVALKALEAISKDDNSVLDAKARTAIAEDLRQSLLRYQMAEKPALLEDHSSSAA